MIYTPLTNRAMQIAYAAHHGQLDKCGMPYIFHPFHLAEQMDDEYAVCVALLHDVLEDTDYPREALAAEFPAEVMVALDLLTHQRTHIRSIQTICKCHNVLNIQTALVCQPILRCLGNG